MDEDHITGRDLIEPFFYGILTFVTTGDHPHRELHRLNKILRAGDVRFGDWEDDSFQRNQGRKGKVREFLKGMEEDRPSGEELKLLLGTKSAAGAAGRDDGPEFQILMLGPEDLVDLFENFGLGDPLRERQFLHQEGPDGIEHLPLAERKFLVDLQKGEIPQDLGNLIN